VPGPHLVVVPLSVLSSWLSELRRWCPALRVVRLHAGDVDERKRLRREVRARVAGRLRASGGVWAARVRVWGARLRVRLGALWCAFRRSLRSLRHSWCGMRASRPRPPTRLPPALPQRSSPTPAAPPPTPPKKVLANPHRFDVAVTTYEMVNSQHFGGALKTSIFWRYLVGG
jgi:SNF2 family DNA or RNA helicase